MLKAFTRCTKDSILRDVDSVTRYEGEEFLIVLPETEINSPCVVAEGLHSDASQRLTKMQREEAFITSSFAPTGFNPDILNERISPEAMIRNADKHLHQAKRRERNTVVGGQLVVQQTQRQQVLIP